jgi:Tol biopolymer transport system component
MWPASATPRASLTRSSAPPNGLYAAQALLYDCGGVCPLPAGFYKLWRGEGDGVFHRLNGLGRNASFSTPTPPTISRDGRWIAYAGPRRRLVVQALDLEAGATVGEPTVLPKILNEDGETPTPAWSPDSGALTVAGRVGRRRGLWVVNRDGTGLRRIVCACDVEALDFWQDGEWPAWSNAGVIAFTGSPSRYSERAALYLVAADGTGLRRITKWRRGLVTGFPAWSPDGLKLAFSLYGEFERATFVVDSAGNKQTVRGAFAPAWSPDGASLAYFDRHGIATAPADGYGPVHRVREPARLRTDGVVIRLLWLDATLPRA